MLRLRSTFLVLLLFAAGYHLSYLFRVINAVIAPSLVEAMGLDAAQLGFLTSVYFLTFASIQLPLGAAIDRFGPRRVQGFMLLFAASGALVFASARDPSGLMIGRGLIGLGFAGALVSGVKVIAEVFPRDRRALINGAFIAFGAAGAIVATTPLEWLLSRFDWREVFVLLGGATAVVALLILLVASDTPRRTASAASTAVGMRAIFVDPRFWRLAPLSALCIGSAWALQGLWAAPWLADVALLERGEVVHHLFIMAVSLCAGALMIGIVADGARRYGIGSETILMVAACTFVAAEFALVSGLNLPSIALWAVIAAMGATTVLSYALLADLYPHEVAGRANAALNLLHIGGAFALQTAIGVILGLWPRDAAGHYPPQGYQAALLALIMLQVAALVWFVRPYWRTAPPEKPAAIEG